MSLRTFLDRLLRAELRMEIWRCVPAAGTPATRRPFNLHRSKHGGRAFIPVQRRTAALCPQARSHGPHEYAATRLVSQLTSLHAIARSRQEVSIWIRTRVRSFRPSRLLTRTSIWSKAAMTCAFPMTVGSPVSRHVEIDARVQGAIGGEQRAKTRRHERHRRGDPEPATRVARGPHQIGIHFIKLADDLPATVRARPAPPGTRPAAPQSPAPPRSAATKPKNVERCRQRRATSATTSWTGNKKDFPVFTIM